MFVSLFLYTGISKLTVLEISREQMAIMPLVGQFSGLISWSLPTFEIILSIIVFIPATRRIGIYVCTALMFAFSLYVIYIMKNYTHLPCTCGGFLQALSWPQHLVFNITFFILGIIFIIKDKLSSKLNHLKYPQSAL